MIEAKETIIGNIASSSSLSGSLNKGVEYIDPVTQEKATTPTKEQQVLVPDDGFTGLSKVTIEPIPDEYIVPTGAIDIDKVGTYDVTDYVEANVEFDMSDATATSGDIASGKTAYTSEGLVTGTGALAPIVEKGLRIDGYDSKGFVNEITVLGLTELPNYYLNTAGKGWCNGSNVKVHLPNNLKKLGEYALAEFTNLVEINIPDSIEYFGDRVFYNNKKMPLDKLPPNLKNSGNYCYYNCALVSFSTIPKGITILWQNEYYGCKAITELTCEGNITQVSANCFTNSGLKKISFPNNTQVPSLVGSTAFNNTPLETIEVPSALLEQWKSATNWSAKASIIVGI
jgi:hypothetical protein